MREILNAKKMDATLRKLGDDILARNEDHKNLAIVGIHTRGVPLAKRLQKILEEKSGLDTVPFGTVDITLYRDDVSELFDQPQAHSTDILFEIAGKDIILVDDVLYTGRTVRSAIDEIIDFGRPSSIQLLVLVDRGGHELPICADYTGEVFDLKDPEYVKVKVGEIDGEDRVIIEKRED
ncbi:MAG: bifunctional pyr operon transcriptional regulator/uracil phosphoribosyltransferase PyrR [Candidatus Zixiibacteriota bacterium]